MDLTPSPRTLEAPTSGEVCKSQPASAEEGVVEAGGRDASAGDADPLSSEKVENSGKGEIRPAELDKGCQPDQLSSDDRGKHLDPKLSHAAKLENEDKSLTTAIKKAAERNPLKQQEHNLSNKQTANQDTEQNLTNDADKTEPGCKTEQDEELDNETKQTQLESPKDKLEARLPAKFKSPKKSPMKDGSVDLTSPSAVKGALAAAKTLTKSKSPSLGPTKLFFHDESF